MSDSISRYYDDMEDYTTLCESFNIKQRYDSFYKHKNEIFRKLGTRSRHEFWTKIQHLKEDGWDEEHIKNFFNIE